MTMPASPGRRFSGLRGARWRVDLGILPSSAAVSTDELRRVAADSRRRYANLRRRLLIDPHLSKDEDSAPDLVVENPLSQNPASTWGQFFKNAELEKMLNQDLSRLYPELGDFFQTAACQSMLGRILLVWSLRYPEYGYRQGMHELLAPLLYVLHTDVQHFYQVRGLHEELFSDDFDGQSFPERLKLNRTDRKNSVQGKAAKIRSLDELDPDTRDLFLINDAYGAEGELGIILSEKFMEHDAYCMFESLMNGAQGVIAVTDFYSLSPAPESSTGLTPVREASSALYHLLGSVDSSLHSHLVELGVEPQYFALRWLRVLFGREFSLDNLLFIWDEIFSSPNHLSYKDMTNRTDYHFRVLCSPRGALILSMAVSMMLHLRSSLLASEHATACLVRLLNFPEDIDLKKLIEKANLLETIALEANIPSSSLRGTTVMTPSNWEETWKMLQKSGGRKHGGSIVRKRGKGLFKGRLFHSGSDTSGTKTLNCENDDWTSSTIQNTVDVLDDTDTVSERLTNGFPHMANDVRKGVPGEGIADGIESNGVGEGGLHAGCWSPSGEIRDPLRTDTGYISRTSASLSCSSDNDHDIHPVEESSTSSDDKMFNESDPLSEILAHQPLERSPLSAGDEKLKVEDRENCTTSEETHKETLEVGSSSNVVDKELIGTLRSLGESMLENIQVIEMLFQQDFHLTSVNKSSNNVPGCSEQPKAVAALEELRKISDLLRRI